MSSIKKNFIYQSIYQITTMLLPMITSPYLSRALGVEKIGVYSYTYAIAYYFMMTALLGIANYGNKCIAVVRDEKDRLNTTFSELLVLHCLIALFSTVMYYFYVLIFARENKICLIIQGLWVLSAFFDISWFYFGLENFKMTVVRSTVVKIVMTIATFLFVHEANDIEVYCLIMAGGTCLSQIILWPFLINDVKFVSVTWEGIKQHIKPMLVLFLPTIAVTIYKFMDKIMLGSMTTKIQVGYYENAEKAINIPVSIVNSFGMVMLPRMANMFSKGDNQKGISYIEKSMEVIMCLTCAMMFGIAGIADRFAITFWGKEFAECGRLIELLSVTIIALAFANVLRMQYLIPKGKNKSYVVSVCVGAVVNVIINSICIPKFEGVGAVIGTIFAEFSVCLVQSFEVRKELSIIRYIKRTFPFFLFGLIMYLIIFVMDKLIRNTVIGLLVQVMVGGLIYCSCCLIYFYRKSKRNGIF